MRGLAWQVNAVAAREVVQTPCWVNRGTHEHELQVRTGGVHQVPQYKHGEVRQNIPFVDLIYENARYAFKRWISHHGAE